MQKLLNLLSSPMCGDRGRNLQLTPPETNYDEAWAQPGFFRGEHFFQKSFKNIQKNFKNFLKFSNKYLKKIAKMDFLEYFSQNLTNPAFHFCAFGRKTLIAEIFEKIFLRKLRKMHYFSIFFKQFNKPCVNFSHVWTKNANAREILKIFDENSIEKVNYLFIFLENLLLKIEPSEITQFFYNNFVGFGGREFPPPPWLRPCDEATVLLLKI